MTWTFTNLPVAEARTQAGRMGLTVAVVVDDWVRIQDVTSGVAACGPFQRGRFLMNEELVAAAAVRLTTERPEAAPLAPTAELWQSLATAAGDAALLFASGGCLDHRAMSSAGFARWFTHAGQAYLRRDQLAPALEKRLREEPALAQLSVAAPDSERLDTLYNNYCLLTGQLPRYRRPKSWWQALLARTDVTVRTIDLPTYDEEDPEALTGPLEPSGYVVYRDQDGRREMLETVVSVIDGDEDENIDMLLNDALHTLVRGAFWPTGAAAGECRPIEQILWHGSPGDLMWSRTSMYGAEMREQTQTHYVKVLKPDLVASQLIKPAIEQETEGDFDGEITVDLTDLEKIAFRRKGDRKAGRLTVRISTPEFVSCMLHPYRLTGLVAEGGIEFDCDDPEVDPMWVVFSSLFDVLHPYWPVLE